ncbi:MAG TPA: hypothetical protein VLL08_04100, partial [Kineosporiaceae bacterium]|nr:hypothetical protein [Kineosporiaceae bacterium]
MASVPAAGAAGGMVVSTGLDCDLGSRRPHLWSNPVLTGSRATAGALEKAAPAKALDRVGHRVAGAR